MTPASVVYLGTNDGEAARCLRVLRRAGFVTVRATRGSEAALACAAGKIRLVVFDLRGVGNPWCVLEQLHNCGAEVIVIATAARGRVALQKGAWDYLNSGDVGYVRDLPYTIVRARTYTQLRRQYVGRAADPSRTPRATAPCSLTDAIGGALAEEIKGPLVAVRRYSQLLKAPGAFDPGVVALARRLDARVEHVMKLVEALADALRAQSASGTRARVAADFNRLVVAAVERAKRRMRTQRRIELHPARLLPTVVLDHERVARLLDGLLSLALAGVPAGGVIRVATGVQRRQVMLRLESHHGIHGDGWGRPRRREAGVDSALTTALARAIGDAHGGALTMERTPDESLGMTMRLPIGETRWAVGQ